MKIINTIVEIIRTVKTAIHMALHTYQYVNKDMLESATALCESLLDTINTSDKTIKDSNNVIQELIKALDINRSAAVNIAKSEGEVRNEKAKLERMLKKRAEEFAIVVEVANDCVNKRDYKGLKEILAKIDAGEELLTEDDFRGDAE